MYPRTRPIYYAIALMAIILLTGCETDYYATFPENHGMAKVSISLDPEYLNWELKLKNLDMVTMAHIHCLPGNYVGVSFSSTVFNLTAPVKGTAITPDKGNLCKWLTFKDVKAAIAAGNAYVNVHTYEKPAGAAQAPLISVSLVRNDWWGRYWERINDNR